MFNDYAKIQFSYYNKAVLYYTQHPESLINIEKFVIGIWDATILVLC